MRSYFTPLFVFAIGLLFFALPELAAALLGGLFVSIGIIYAWLVHRFRVFNKYTNEDRFSSFEKDVFKQGQPGIKTFTSIVVRRFEH
jgi:hypothetical protein